MTSKLYYTPARDLSWKYQLPAVNYPQIMPQIRDITRCFDPFILLCLFFFIICQFILCKSIFFDCVIKCFVKGSFMLSLIYVSSSSCMTYILTYNVPFLFLKHLQQRKIYNKLFYNMTDSFLAL